MTSHLHSGGIAALMIFAAIGYAVATVGMKMASDALSPLALAVVVAGLLAAVLAEVVLLRHSDLAVIYIGVIVAESILVLAYAAHLQGSLNSLQIIGASLVLGGFALVTLGE